LKIRGCAAKRSAGACAAAAFVFFSPAALAQDKNQQWKNNETWYQFTDKEQGASTHQRPSRGAAPAHTQESETVPVPYILQPGPADPAPATSHIETTLEPVIQPGAMAMPYWNGVAPFYGAGHWGGNGIWGGNGFGFGGGYGRPGWGAPLGAFPFGPSMTLRPSSRVVQSGPSKASGNYFNPSTPDPTASGSYYAGSGNTPRAVPVYQSEPETKDYWGKDGSPLPPEMQPQ
jgi:hypothetical protein